VNYKVNDDAAVLVSVNMPLVTGDFIGYKNVSIRS